MSENVEIFKRFMVEGFEGGNLDVVDELISPDIVEHQFGFEGSGEEVREKLKKAITDLHGFLHGPLWFVDCLLLPSAFASSVSDSLPSNTAPASRSRVTILASRVGTRSTCDFVPHVVRIPAVSTRSFTAYGMP